MRVENNYSQGWFKVLRAYIGTTNFGTPPSGALLPFPHV